MTSVSAASSEHEVQQPTNLGYANTNIPTSQPSVETQPQMSSFTMQPTQTTMESNQAYVQPPLQQPVAAPVPQKESHGMANTSLFHAAKRRLMGVRPEFDQNYLSFRHHHEEISALLAHLQQHFARYTDLSRSTFQESNTIARDIGSVLNDSSAQYGVTMATSTDVHYEIAASSSNVIAENLISSDMRNRIEEPMNRCRELSKRMKEHEELKAEVDYYARKVDKLRHEKDSLAPGTQRPKLDERLDRNISKYENLHIQFSQNHTTLLHDLADLWLNRAQFIAPVYSLFINVERELARRHFDMLTTIDTTKLRDIPLAPQSAYPVYTHTPANYHLLKKPAVDIMPATEHSVSEGDHLDTHDIENTPSTSGVVPVASNISNISIPSNEQPSATTATSTTPAAPPRPPRPSRNLTLGPGAVDQSQPGFSNEGVVPETQEVPPYKAEHPGVVTEPVRLDSPLERQLQAMQTYPAAPEPFREAKQSLLREGESTKYADLKASTEGQKPARSLVDLIPKSSPSTANLDPKIDNPSVHVEKPEDNAHIASESRDERSARDSAVFDAQPQRSQRSNVIEYI